VPASSRLKPLSLLLAALLAASGLLAWAMPWFTVTLAGSDIAVNELSVSGETAAPALAALSVAGLALVAALAIARPVLRMVLGGLEALIGIGVVVSGASALAEPIAASAPLVTQMTGLDGTESVTAAINSISTGPGSIIAVVAGILMIALGTAIAITTRRWPGASHKYQATGGEGSDEPRSAVSDWDRLSEGDDPTGESSTGRL
jgi:uncharacterized membrane protein (TIGR02234 family)